MLIYRPKTLVLELSPELIYVLPNQGSYQALSTSPGGIPEGSLIWWALDALMPENKVFIDIGANVGTWTIPFAASKKVMAVHSFEPQTHVREALYAGIAFNRLVEKVIVHKVALGSEEQVGYLDLKIISEDGGGSSICSLPTNRWCGSETVQVETADNVLRHEKDIGLIKIDVEGNELEVLQGMSKVLIKNNYPKILFEAWLVDWYYEKKQKTFDYLVSLGYKIVNISGYSEVFLAEKV